MNKRAGGYVLAGILIAGGMFAYAIFRDPQAEKVASDVGVPRAHAVVASPPTSPNSTPVTTPPATRVVDVDTAISQLQASGASSGEIALANAKAIDECRAINGRTNYVAETVKQYGLAGARNLESVRKYASELVEGCANFASTHAMTKAAQDEFYAKAAAAGSIEANSRQLKNDVFFSAMSPSGDTLTADDFKPQLISFLGSGDPGAIFELSDLLGEGSKLGGPAAGSAKAAAAWVLVACDLGLDCAYGGSTLRAFCLNGGIYCGAGDLRQNMANSQFAPEEFSDVVALERTIYAKLKSGNVEELFK